MRYRIRTWCLIFCIASAGKATAQSLDIAADLSAKMTAAERMSGTIAYTGSIITLTAGQFVSRVTSVTPATVGGSYYPLNNCQSSPVTYPSQSLSTSVTNSVSTSYSSTLSKGSSGSVGLSIGPISSGTSFSTNVATSRGREDQQSYTFTVQINTAEVTVAPMSQVIVQAEITMNNESRSWTMPVIADAPAIPGFGVVIPAPSAVLSEAARTYTLSGTMTNSWYAMAAAYVFPETPLTAKDCESAQQEAGRASGTMPAPVAGIYRLRQGGGRLIGTARPR